MRVLGSQNSDYDNLGEDYRQPMGEIKTPMGDVVQTWIPHDDSDEDL